MSPLPIHQKFDNCFRLKRERTWNICMEAERVVYGGKDAKAVLPIVHGGKVLVTRVGS